MNREEQDQVIRCLTQMCAWAKHYSEELKHEQDASSPSPFYLDYLQARAMIEKLKGEDE
jgi:hypothetical protein